jgi:hypothetical protein
MGARITWSLSCAFLLSGGAALAQEVRITAVNGTLAPSGKVEQVSIKPGQVVSLSADEVWRNADGQLEYGYRAVEDFVWSSDLGADDRCDTETGDCRQNSNFEVTKYGVNFYVPWQAPSRITVSVKLKWGEGTDSVALDNEAAQQQTVQGPAPEPSVQDTYLEGLGYWTVVSGNRVFVPVAYEENWTPYQNGYWYWSSYGWTWYSYDPWGYVTDHCGHWRHSIRFGWVWIPDPVCTWRPAVVSFYFGPDYIGWYPYDSGWGHGYRHGYADGYDDGFWMGYWVGNRTHGHGHWGVRPGFSAVHYNDFYRPGHDRGGPPDRAHPGEPPPRNGPTAPKPWNVRNVLARDSMDVNKAFNDAIRNGHVGPVPGGGKDPSSGRDFIADRGGSRPEETKMRPAWNDASGRHGKTVWMEPDKPVHETPSEFKDITRRTLDATGAGRNAGPGSRVPVGRTSVDRPGDREHADRTGAAMPPRSEGRSNREPVSWEPRGRDPGSRATGDRGPGTHGGMVPAAREPGSDRPARDTGVRPQDPGRSSRTGEEPRTGPQAPSARPGNMVPAGRPSVDETRKPFHMEDQRTPKEWRPDPLRHHPDVNGAGRATPSGVRQPTVTTPTPVRQPTVTTPTPVRQPATTRPSEPVRSSAQPARTSTYKSTPVSSSPQPVRTPAASSVPTRPSSSNTSSFRSSGSSSSSSTFRPATPSYSRPSAPAGRFSGGGGGRRR